MYFQYAVTGGGTILKVSNSSIRCSTADNGEKFVIELQHKPQINLKKRVLYYSSKIIADQAPKGKRRDWNYAITEVYIVVLMDGFTFSNAEESEAVLHDICLCNRGTGEVFYDDLGFIYVQLRNFTKKEAELGNDLDRWLFVLRNMSTLDKISTYLRKPIFEKLFQIAEYARLNKEERAMYNVSLKRKWDAEAVRQYQEQEHQKQLTEAIQKAEKEAIDRGIKQGIEQSIEAKSHDVIENLITELKLSDETIAQIVKVSIEFVKKIRTDLEKDKK
ncbi:MAG: PD-(D/E)XK nuclease family transposase [Sphingobacterium sp.]